MLLHGLLIGWACKIRASLVAWSKYNFEFDLSLLNKLQGDEGSGRSSDARPQGLPLMGIFSTMQAPSVWL